MNGEQQTIYYLGVALAIGLLIGVERGWIERDAREGGRVAGVRTYGLIGLLGGVLAVLSEFTSAWLLGFGFVALAGVLATVYVVNRHRDDDVGITSLVAAVLTFALGALAAKGELAVAVAAAVVTTLLLSYKPLLHRWVQALEGEELRAGIKLLLISVVALPLLPDQGYGPWQALNPYQIWWMVVLVAGVSFVGYFAIKLGGARRGTLFTGVFGGLASSTALTLHFSRMSGRDASMAPILSMGILLACGTMFPRMLLLAGLLNPNLLKPMLVPAIAMALIVYLPALRYWRSHPHVSTDTSSSLKNPLELVPALGFGVLLAIVLLLGNLLEHTVGATGVLALAAASGVADVDAITLSLARMSQNSLAVRIAVAGVVVAAAVNSIVKAIMATAIGGREIGKRVALPLTASAVSGVLITWWWLWLVEQP